jgi:hypothetical protein
MSREHLVYNKPAETVRVYEGFDVDVPIAGLYKMKLRSGGYPVAVRIFYGPPLDPVTGEELDRGWRWQSFVNGQYHSLELCWPRCAADPITQKEADYLAKVQKWGQENAPDSPQANPHKRVDLLTAPLPF